MMKNLLKSVAILLVSVLFVSCSDTEETKVVNFISNSADFVVKNQTTGESAKNLETGLVVKNGDVLELTYACPSEYQKYSWMVEFELFDSETVNVSRSPYTCTYTVKDLSAGNYSISCSATISDPDVEGTSLDAGIVGVNVVE